MHYEYDMHTYVFISYNIYACCVYMIHTKNTKTLSGAMFKRCKLVNIRRVTEKYISYIYLSFLIIHIFSGGGGAIGGGGISLSTLFGVLVEVGWSLLSHYHHHHLQKNQNHH